MKIRTKLIFWFLTICLLIAGAGYVYIRMSQGALKKSIGESDTILTQDFDAVCMLAASKACGSMAAKYTRSSESTLSVDIASLVTRRMEYQALQKTLRDNYFTLMGIDPKKVAATPAMSDGDIDPKFAGRYDYLTHQRRYR